MSKLTDLVHGHYDAANAGDIDGGLEHFDEDVVTVTPDGILRGLAPFRSMGEGFLAAVPDQKMSIRHIYEAGDTVIVEGDYSGTQTGDLVGAAGTIPATGQSFSFPFCDVFTVANGNVVRHAIYWDNMGFLAQLGLTGSPEPQLAH